MATVPSSIEQIWIFGSVARNEAEVMSDTDILVVTETGDEEFIKQFLFKKFGRQLDIATYTYAGIKKIVTGPSLFAVHLQKEAIPIYEKTPELKDMLSAMKDYKSHLTDMMTLETLLEDVKGSAASRSPSIIFELGVLGTVVRNIGIIMSHFVEKIDFSVNAPLTVGKYVNELSLPFDKYEYDLLLNSRRAAERGKMVKTNLLSTKHILRDCKLVEQWHKTCVNYIEKKREVR